jgi:hypothetical protein
MKFRGMLVAYPSLLLLLSNLPTSLAQVAAPLPSTPSATFPACALNCVNINAASSFCTQTNSASSQGAVDSCFCKRPEVVPFYQGTTGVCDVFCTSPADLSTLQKWFKDYCAAAGVGSDGTITTLITSTRSPTNTASGSSATGPGSGSKSSSSRSSGW